MNKETKFIFDGLINNHDRLMSDYHTMMYNRHQSTAEERGKKLTQAAEALKLSAKILEEEMK